MHAIIHRALTPQTVSHIWLVATLALTLALAVVHSAVAHASTSGGPTVTPMVMQLATATVAAPAGQGPIAHHDVGGCRARAVAEEREAIGDPRPPGPWTCASVRPFDAAPAVPPALFAPDPRTGADALAALYGGAGPHGPPVRAVPQPIISVLPQRTTERAAITAFGPAAPSFPTGPAPAITTAA